MNTTLLKWIITIGLLAITSQMVHLETVMQTLLSASAGAIVTAIAIQTLSTFLAAYRWSLIMDSLQFHESYRVYLASYYKGAFFNQALPGSIGGDAVRVLEFGSMGYRKKEAFYGIFIDRIVGLVGLLLLNLGANLYSGALLPSWLFGLINMIALGGIAGFALLIVLHKFSFLSAYRITNLLSELSSRFRQVYRGKKAILTQLTLSVIIHFLSIVALYEIARSVGMGLSIELFFVAVPPVFLLTIVPISLAGWGVRESAMIGIFMLIGASKETILSVSILYGIMLIIASLPGLFIWLSGKKLV